MKKPSLQTLWKRSCTRVSGMMGARLSKSWKATSGIWTRSGDAEDWIETVLQELIADEMKQQCADTLANISELVEDAIIRLLFNSLSHNRPCTRPDKYHGVQGHGKPHS